MEENIAIAALFALASELSTLFRGGGFWDGLESFGKAFIEGLLLAGVFRLGFAVAPSFTLGVGLGLSGNSIYKAADNLYHANGVFDGIADGIDLLVGIIGGYLGIRGFNARAKAKGGDTEAQTNDLDKLSRNTGVSVEKLSPGPIDQSIVKVTDPDTGHSVLTLDVDLFALENPGADPFETDALRSLGPNDQVVIIVDEPVHAKMLERDVVNDVLGHYGKLLTHVKSFDILYTEGGELRFVRSSDYSEAADPAIDPPAPDSGGTLPGFPTPRPPAPPPRPTRSGTIPGFPPPPPEPPVDPNGDTGRFPDTIPDFDTPTNPGY
jgi:hypothetical protein